LLHKCRRCGRCCRGQLYNALMLTFGDIQRLAKQSKCKMKPSQFIEKLCIFGTIHEGPNIQIPFYPHPVTVEYTACFLKRYAGETEETITQPHPCGFITEENLCSIYENRPVACQKFPYTTLHKDGLTHACYVDVPYSDCEGYIARPQINKKKLSKLAPILEKADLEIKESMETGMIIITNTSKNGL